MLKNLIKKLRAIFKADAESEDFVFFICEGNALPEPLKADEEAALLTNLSLGDEKAKPILIERNLRLVVYIAKKFTTSGHSIDDLISIGSIGLIKAINSFKMDKNIKLATYASRCIENEILMFLRKTVRNKSEISLDEPIKKDFEGNELLLADILPGENSEALFKNIEEQSNNRVLVRELSKLSGREKEIMTLRFGLDSGEEKTQKEVADTLNISQSYISRLEKKIILRLKKDLKKVF